MAEKKFHKGWLYERDGVKFAPYTLKESIVDRDGNTGWAVDIDSKLTELEDIFVDSEGNISAQFESLEARTQTLEERTQYLNAEASDTFYITDGEGNIGLKVDADGATSYNFITSTTDLNSLTERTDEIEDVISSIQGDSLTNLQDQIIALQERTRFMDASDSSDAFYITDGNGNIAAIINGSGVTSFNFISKGVTDLNSLYQELQNQGIIIQEIQDTLSDMNNAITTVADRATALEERTKYMDTSEESDTFYITDKDGNVILKVDSEGVHSIEFTAEGLQLKATIEALLAKDVDIVDALSALTDRAAELELKTKFLNASAEDNGFYITDSSGNIGFLVDDNGATSIDFITSTGIKLSEVKSNLDTEIVERKAAIELLEKADDELSDSITNLDTTLNTKIEETKTELQNNINAVNTNLTNSIADTKAELEESINDLSTHVDEKDSELADNLGEVTTRVADLETRTKYMDASTEDSSFYITDGDGNIGFEVNNEGAFSSDFTTSGGIKLSEVKANLDVEIQARKDADTELNNKDTELSDAINSLDTQVNNRITEVNTALTTLITETKEELQTEIDTTESNINTTINNLATELRNKDTELSDSISKNGAAIESLEGRMDIAENDIDSLEANSATKEELAENVEIITNRLDGHDEAISAINDINDQQNDALSDLTPRVVAVETRTQFMDASTEDSSFYITDGDGNIGFEVNNEGAFSSDFTTSGGIKLSEVKANLDVEIQARKDADTELNNKDTELSDAINSLDTQVNNRITEVNTALTTLITETKEELQTEIDTTESNINTTINNLATELRNKDTELSDSISKNGAAIESLEGRMDIAENDIDSLEANSATKEELAENVEIITNRLDGHDEAISAINDINDQQNDALSDLTPRVVAVETRTQFMDASAPDAFYITDENGYPGFIFDADGVLALQYRMKTTAKNILPLIGYEKTGTITI